MNTFRNILIATCCLALVATGESTAQSSKKKKAKAAQEAPAPQVQVQAPSERDRQISEAMFLDGMKYFMLEDYQQALQLFQKAYTVTPDNAALNYKIGETYLHLKEPKSAMPFAQAAVNLEKKNAYYYLLLAQLHTEQQQYDAAAQAFNALLANVPNSNEYLFNLADLYLSQSRYDDALKTYERIEKEFGDMEQLLVNRQQIYLRQKNVDKAIAEGEKLLKSNPTEIRYFLSQAELYNASRRTDEAISTLNKALRLEPGNPFAHLMLSDLSRQKGEFKESEKQVKLAFASSELDIDTKVRILVDFIRQLPNPQIEPVALELVDLTIEKHPEEAKAYAVAADLQTIVGKKAIARDNYLKAVKLDDSHFKIWQQIVLLDAELEQPAEMVEHAEQALELFPNQAVFWFYSGTGHLIEKNFEKAVKALEYGKRLSVSEPELEMQFNMQLGDGYNSLKDFKKSDSAYEAVLVQDANNEHVLNNYSYFLSLRGEKLDRAKQMSEQLVKQHPTNPTYLDTYAWVLYKMGNYTEARKFLEQAVAISDDATIVEHYGDVLYKLGKKDEAVSQWQKAKLKGEASAFIDRKIKEKKLYE
ncbi:tetratricopeptide repeat protein [Pontibacter anaerobius]|uniref:Tetratricopeptide repeat protein n=1 Tax=Pontibacter anaerobius TaxID=2993940 RepID=A0ABT3RKN8_9BACT|nr:tetratricopeptide repeat protein [Pontibacter anaerobius]MCX2742126.1 tetratricopeptide repeat protein [Pontibacter anaerobius]